VVETSGIRVAVFCHCRQREVNWGVSLLKSWGAIVITAVGFLVGVVLAGIGGISAKTAFFVDPRSDSKKIEKYWADTGLGKKELFDLISNMSCQSSEKYFLACVNSITQNLESSLRLMPETGELETKSNSTDDEELNEKQKLAGFVMMYSKQMNHLVDFEKIWEGMLNAEKEENRPYLIASGINSFLSIYKDPHTYILPENYYDEVGSQIERSNLFVGLSFEKVNHQIVIRKVFKNSDAEAAGLESFDVLKKINKIETKNLSLLEISHMLKDSSYKSFEFEIMRKNEIKIVQINRRFQHLSHVQFQVLTGLKNFISITLTKFSRGVCEEVSKKINSVSDKNIAGLILDLRDNPGGQLDEAACLAGLFFGMNKKTYSVEFFDPIKSNEVVLSTGSLLYTGPMVVLTNSSSASASELLAGALQDYKRALIISEKTFGKGTFQESEEWSKNPKISLFKTQGFYLLPSNSSPQLTGIHPDIEFEEGHVKVREENTYFNPLANNKTAFSEVHKNTISYNESLELCLHYSDVIAKKDPMLQKALQVLSCHRIVAGLALQFRPDDFN
jgi:carboxyl-terminal processing protease